MKNRHLIVIKAKEIAEDFAFELEKIEELKAQCETYFDELPDKLKDDVEGEELSDRIEDLEEIYDSLYKIITTLKSFALAGDIGEEEGI